MELAALERATELLDEEGVAGHVSIPGVPFPRNLLDHEDGVAEAKNPPYADFSGESEAVCECLVLGDVFGGGKVYLESIFELVPFWGR